MAPLFGWLPTFYLTEKNTPYDEISNDGRVQRTASRTIDKILGTSNG